MVCKAEWRMARIAALILRPDIHDLRFWPLRLDFERGHQSILGVHDDVVRLAAQF